MKSRALQALELLKQECASHLDCIGCGFYAGSDMRTQCIFHTPIIVSQLEIKDLPNLEKEFNAASMMEVALDSERKL